MWTGLQRPRVIMMSGEEIACKAIELIKAVSTELSPRLQTMVGDSHEKCCEQFGHYADNNQELSKFAEEAVKQDVPADFMCTKSQWMADRMCRVARVLQEYIKKCDSAFNGTCCR